MYPLETNGDARKLNWQYKVGNMPKERLPTIADRAVWEKVKKGRAGKGGTAQSRKYGSMWEESDKRCCPQISLWSTSEKQKKGQKEEKGYVALKKYGERGTFARYVEMYEGSREEIGMKTYLHGPMDCAKTLELRFRVGDLNLPERRKRKEQSSHSGRLNVHGARKNGMLCQRR